MTPNAQQTVEKAADHYPYPIARACLDFLDKDPQEPWKEWELLCRDVLQPILKYLQIRLHWH